VLSCSSASADALILSLMVTMVIAAMNVENGWQTCWNGKTGVHKALFWDYKDFQDRTVTIWEHLAEVSLVVSFILTHRSVLTSE
jgi:hypothetical protein